MGGRKQESIALQVGFWALDWSMLMAFWLALIGEFRLSLLVIGASAALIGSFISLAAESQTLIRFLPNARYLLDARSVLWQVPVGTAQVLWMVLRGEGTKSGKLYYTPFNAGSEEKPTDEARRTIAEAFPTFSPTSVVLGVDQRNGTAVFHLLGTESLPPTLKRLGNES